MKHSDTGTLFDCLKTREERTEDRKARIMQAVGDFCGRARGGRGERNKQTGRGRPKINRRF